MTTRCCLLIIWLASACALLCPQTSLADKGAQNDERLCGPQCLLAVCHKLGVEASLEELIQLTRWDQNAGASMLGLLEAAKQKGLRASGMKLSIDEVVSASVRTPSIAHLRGEHFVLVEGGTADSILVRNQDGLAQSVPRSQFTRAYSGFALLVSREAISVPDADPRRPDLRIDPLAWDFGVVEEGAVVEHVFKCSNRGGGEVVVSKLLASCTCMRSSLSCTRIPPGGEAELRLSLDTSSLRGQQLRELQILSNDPTTPRLAVQLSGVVKPTTLLVSARQVDFADVRKGTCVTKETYIPTSASQDVNVIRAYADAPAVTVRLSQDKSASHLGTVVTLTFALAGNVGLGRFRGRVSIETTHPKEPKVEVLLTARVLGSVDLLPSQFMFGIVKRGKAAETTVTLTTVRTDALKIERIDTPAKGVSVTVKPKVEGKEYLLTVALSPDAPPGYINGEVITIHTNDPDQPEIKVPVYALVED